MRGGRGGHPEKLKIIKLKKNTLFGIKVQRKIVRIDISRLCPGCVIVFQRSICLAPTVHVYVPGLCTRSAKKNVVRFPISCLSPGCVPVVQIRNGKLNLLHVFVRAVY